MIFNDTSKQQYLPDKLKKKRIVYYYFIHSILKKIKSCIYFTIFEALPELNPQTIIEIKRTEFRQSNYTNLNLT